MVTTIRGTHTPSLRILRGVLNKWINTNLRFVRYWKDAKDVPWWYNERASISVLAGAVWQCGGIAFEEYAADKNARKGSKYNGRGDLYLKVRDQHFIAEAKQWSSGASRVDKRTSQSMQKQLDEACKDIRRCAPYGQRKLGVLFVTPYIPKSKKKMVNQQLEQWIAMMKTIECSCSAWVFPGVSRLICSSSGFICPGVALLIREVRH